MKNLVLVSFVGVDRQTKFEDLLEFKDANVPYEFSVLYSDSKNDTHTRYPGHDLCKKFLSWADENKVYHSIHLCGSSIDRFLIEDLHVLELCDKSNRIQLNLNIKKYTDHKQLSNSILRVASKYNYCIILQKNGTKKKFNEVFLERMQATGEISLSWLNDSSGGFGREIEQVAPPDPDIFTGFAGGIKPDNVVKIVKLIEKENSDEIPYYIDMESGVRENNQFSIVKCQEIKKLLDNYPEL
jgi:hypothetical protein